MPNALITGITGQDGSYLAEYLLARGYTVYGLIRRTSSSTPWRISHLLGQLRLIEGDLLDQGSLIRAVQDSTPDEVYNLAAQSFVGRSWKEPVHTAEVNGLGALRVFEAVRLIKPDARVYQASTSEMYGNQPSELCDHTGPFSPRSPYGVSKLFAHHSAINMRQSHDLYISTGILFNHESPRRGEEFVTRKICKAAAEVASGKRFSVGLGNLEARRDWGWAPDYVRAMYLLLQQDTPQDVVVASGASHSVRDLCEIAFSSVGLRYEDHVTQDPRYFRPAEIHHLQGNPARAQQLLGWTPEVSFEEMIERMVRAEMNALV